MWGSSYAEGPHNYFIPFLPPAGGMWHVVPVGGHADSVITSTNLLFATTH